MQVDSFKYLSRLVARYYQLTQSGTPAPIPWSTVSRPLNQARFGLVTTGGLYHLGQQPPFDAERERREPTWGDPSYRSLPSDIPQAEVGASHLHLNNEGVRQDVNILLPVNRFQELAEQGCIGGLAPTAYSFMGYQGFPAKLDAWRDVYAPEVADKLLADEVDCVLLTAA